MSANPFRDFTTRIGNSPQSCPECIDGEIDSGRAFPPTMTCPFCNGSAQVWSAEDEQASIADALNDELYVERAQ